VTAANVGGGRSLTPPTSIDSSASRPVGVWARPRRSLPRPATRTKSLPARSNSLQASSARPPFLPRHHRRPACRPRRATVPQRLHPQPRVAAVSWRGGYFKGAATPYVIDVDNTGDAPGLRPARPRRSDADATPKIRRGHLHALGSCLTPFIASGTGSVTAVAGYSNLKSTCASPDCSRSAATSSSTAPARTAKNGTVQIRAAALSELRHGRRHRPGLLQFCERHVYGPAGIGARAGCVDNAVEASSALYDSAFPFAVSALASRIPKGASCSRRRRGPRLQASGILQRRHRRRHAADLLARTPHAPACTRQCLSAPPHSPRAPRRRSLWACTPAAPVPTKTEVVPAAPHVMAAGGCLYAGADGGWGTITSNGCVSATPSISIGVESGLGTSDRWRSPLPRCGIDHRLDHAADGHPHADHDQGRRLERHLLPALESAMRS